jgi:multidrug efflux pump
VGEYTAPLFEVVTISLLCSWILSLTLIPMLGVQFMKVDITASDAESSSRFYLLYKSFLTRCLRNRVTTLIATVVIFFVGMQGFGLVPSIFFPAKDQPTFTAEFDYPVGTPIERTRDLAVDVDQFIARELQSGVDRPEGVKNWATFIGQGPPKFSLPFNARAASPEYMMILVNTTSYGDVMFDAMARLETFILENYPDVDPDSRSLLNGPPVNDPIEIRVSGPDEDVVFSLVDDVKAELDRIAGTKKLVVKIDQPRARRAGLTSQDVAVSLQTGLSGFETTQYREEDEIIPVTLRSVDADRQDVGKLESLNIFSQVTGQTVPLKQVADIEVVLQPAKILRRNRLKQVIVSAGIHPNVTAIAVFEAIRPWLDEQSGKWPVGYGYEFGGEWEASVEGNASIGEKIPIAGLIIVLLLVSQFNSLRKPVIILMTIPLGMVAW